MAAIDWEICEQTHGRMVTCQRPIIIRIKTPHPSVAHFRCDLQVRALEVTEDDYGWISTGLEINAYPCEIKGQYYYYNVNFADYCRNYFHVSNDVLNATYCAFSEATIVGQYGWNIFGGISGIEDNIGYEYMFRREFRAKIWPVLTDTEGLLYEQNTNIDFCYEFMVLNVNTKSGEQTSVVPQDNVRIDSFVNGYCIPDSDSNTYGHTTYLSSKANKLLTNMPGVSTYGQDVVEPVNTLNINDMRMHWVAQGWNFSKFSDGYHRRKFIWEITNATTGAVTTVSLFSSDVPPTTQTNPTDLSYMYLDPFQLQFTFDLNSVGANAILQGGVLQASKISCTVEFWNGSSVQRYGPKFTVNLTDKKNDGHCRKTRFIFMNMRGQLDWFNCYGTVDKSVSFSGTTYERMRHMDRKPGSLNFNRTPSAHATNNIQTQRVDEWTVFSQPLTSQWVEWLQELITSPMVWIEQIMEGHETEPTFETISVLVNEDNIHSLSHSQQQAAKQLVPIIIEPGSYKVFNTEDKVYFLEFKYKLSESITTQKSY